MTRIAELTTTWGSIYANHAALRTFITFVHVAGLVVGGGAAIAADRATVAALRLDKTIRGTQLTALNNTHRVVIGSLVLVAASGALMFAADVDTMLYSRVFWIKMLLVAFLIVNGAFLWAAERRAARRDSTAWRTLHITALASVALWLLATLAGVALLNIG